MARSPPATRRGSNQGNTQNEKSLYHHHSIDFRCYLEMTLSEPRPGLAGSVGLPDHVAFCAGLLPAPQFD